MSTATQRRNPWTRQFGARFVISLSLILGGVAACAPVATQPVDLATATVVPAVPSPTTPVEATLPPVPSGWQTRSASASQEQCGYTISHPAEMQGTSQDAHSWIVSITTTDPEGAARNFVYVSVIPDDFQTGGDELIYNYDPVATQTLLAMQVGESKSIHANTEMAPWFTYNRLPDTMIADQTAQTYENTKPWEFPAGTREIRYFLRANGCTYLIGGYMDTTGSSQAGAINEALFNQILATFRLSS